MVFYVFLFDLRQKYLRLSDEQSYFGWYTSAAICMRLLYFSTMLPNAQSFMR